MWFESFTGAVVKTAAALRAPISTALPEPPEDRPERPAGGPPPQADALSVTAEYGSISGSEVVEIAGFNFGPVAADLECVFSDEGLHLGSVGDRRITPPLLGAVNGYDYERFLNTLMTILRLELAAVGKRGDELTDARRAPVLRVKHVV